VVISGLRLKINFDDFFSLTVSLILCLVIMPCTYDCLPKKKNKEELSLTYYIEVGIILAFVHSLAYYASHIVAY